MTIYKPYTYLIGWSKYNKWYYGVRYAKNCNPTDHWETYFTSSKIVHKMRSIIGEPDIITIRKIFNTNKKATSWEHTVLRRMKVTKRSDFINQTDNIAIILDENHFKTVFTPEVREKMSKSRKKYIENNKELVNAGLDEARKHIDYSSETRNSKISNSHKGKPKNKDSAKKQSASLKRSGKVSGKNNPMYGRSAIIENNLKWYTNGIKDLMLKEGTQPAGYVRGAAVKASKNIGSKRTDDTKNKMREFALTEESVKRSKEKLSLVNAKCCCVFCMKETSIVWIKRAHMNCC